MDDVSKIEGAAHHEAGHCLATVLAFRTARWLPLPVPRWPVRLVEITEDGHGGCFALNIYSPSWGIAPRFHDLMQQQINIYLSGGLSEAVARGVRSRHEALRFAMHNCCMDVDLQRSRALLHDLRRGGCDFSEQDSVDRALTLVLTHLDALEALAARLVEIRRIEGAEIEAIIDAAL